VNVVNGPAMSPDFSVVVPVFNEAGSAPDLAREIAEAFAGRAFEMLFVDDASTDSSRAQLASLKTDLPMLRIIAHGRNAGQSRAIRTGVLAARAPIVITLDGDGQNDPADAPAVAARLMQGPASLGLVSGLRRNRRDSRAKLWASRISNGLRRRLLKDGATDTGCGLKAFRREAYLRLPYFDHQHRFLIALMRREGHGVGFRPVGHRPRTAGRSKYTNFGRMLVSIADLLGMRWLISRHRGPAGTEEL